MDDTENYFKVILFKDAIFGLKINLDKSVLLGR